MNQDKLLFLKTEFVKQLDLLDEKASPAFGKMNVQQMIEHMTYSFRIANGKDQYTILTPEDRLKPMKDFMMSEKDFRPNTPNSLLGDTPEPIRNATKEEALNELKRELNDFINHFEKNPDAINTNPFFGDLNYAEWVQLLHKHTIHHLRQFGVAV